MKNIVLQKINKDKIQLFIYNKLRKLLSYIKYHK